MRSRLPARARRLVRRMAEVRIERLQDIGRGEARRGHRRDRADPGGKPPARARGEGASHVEDKGPRSRPPAFPGTASTIPRRGMRIRAGGGLLRPERRHRPARAGRGARRLQYRRSAAGGCDVQVANFSPNFRLSRHRTSQLLSIVSAAEIKRILSGRDVPSFTSTMISDPTRRIPGTKKPRAAVPAGLRRSYWSAR